MNGEEDIFEVLPEIEHAFRAEQTMPPQIVSLAFTIICLLPSLLLVVSVRFLSKYYTLYTMDVFTNSYCVCSG
jgi:hypothetical protein